LQWSPRRKYDPGNARLHSAGRFPGILPDALHLSGLQKCPVVLALSGVYILQILFDIAPPAAFTADPVHGNRYRADGLRRMLHQDRVPAQG